MPIITTTQTSSNYSIRPEMRFDIEYLRTIHGILKVILLVNCFKSFSDLFCSIFFRSQVLGLINIIIISVAIWYGANGFFNSAIGIGWWFTLIMLVLFLFHVPEKFYTLPWLPIEIGVICLICLLYFISSLIVILISTTTHTVAGVFGFITLGVYAYSGYLKFKAWKDGELAQGSLTRSTQSTTMTESSAYPAQS